MKRRDFVKFLGIAVAAPAVVVKAAEAVNRDYVTPYRYYPPSQPLHPERLGRWVSTGGGARFIEDRDK